MGRAYELITGLNTAPGASMTAATALTGNSFTVRDTRRRARLAAAWVTRQAIGAMRIVSPRLHDNTIGLQIEAGAGAQCIHTPYIPQELFAQDLLSVQQTGSATAGDIEHCSYVVQYEDLPGVEARLMTPPEVYKRAKNLYMQVLTIAAGTSGQYTGSAAINSAQDSFKANTDYALLGYAVNGNACHAVRFVGPDWGNLGIGGPGRLSVNQHSTDRWFVELSEESGFPSIPVMNSANKALTTIDVVQNENEADPVITLYWAEL